MSGNGTTVALSLLIHGDAVRLNRGKSQPDGYDFKFMRGPKTRLFSDGVYPYVSSQCFKKYWRETLVGPFSPITRGKNAAGVEKNQVYTEGNPFAYVDDDLFGYMVAGANSEEESADAEILESNPDQDDAELESLSFSEENIANSTNLLKKFRENKTPLYDFLREHITEEQRSEFETTPLTTEPSKDLLAALIAAMNYAVRANDFLATIGQPLKQKQQKEVESGKAKIADLNRAILLKEFKGELAVPDKRPTTRRTAPIRMHALVAFSGVKTAQDFQTFSRDIAYTGKNSILNPNPVGIYSGWLKTRILIEGHRVGKFYLGENRDMLIEQAKALGEEAPILQENDPYSRLPKTVSYIQMSDPKRIDRIRMVLGSLADIGNRQGPASGALHDGSLKPKGLIGAFMRCADSPFDAVWQGTEDLPYFDKRRLKAVLEDWNDLFASSKIYIGYPTELDMDITDFENELNEDMEDIKSKYSFEFVVKTPRQALRLMAEDVTL